MARFMIPGWVGWEGARGCWVFERPPSPKKNFKATMGKVGQKMAFLAIFIANPLDFHKSAVKFH
jgi:hypothetical protein